MLRRAAEGAVLALWREPRDVDVDVDSPFILPLECSDDDDATPVAELLRRRLKFALMLRRFSPPPALRFIVPRPAAVPAVL